MLRPSLLALVLLALLVAPTHAWEASPTPGAGAGSLSIIASGLTNPRGMVWAADGTLYVAEAGIGGASLGTPEAEPPLGPIRGGSTASVVRIESGCPVPVAAGLPSALTATGEALGVEALAILNDHLYAAVDGGGEAHGNAAQPAGVYRILSDGTAELVADLSAWVRANPVAQVPPDHDPDAAGFGMVADPDAGLLWVNDPNSSQILTVSPDGVITRIADLSKGHPVTTGLALAPQGGIYVGTLTPVPYPDGSASVLHITADGTTTTVWTGLTAVTDVAVGPDGSLYAVEMSTGNTKTPPFVMPGSGRIVRQTGPAAAEDVATGLMFPVALSFGPDGGLYVSLPASGADHGEGVVARLDVAAGQVAASPAAMMAMAGAAGCAPAVATPIS